MPNQLKAVLKQILRDQPTTDVLGRDLTVELSRLALATRLDEFDGPVEGHHRWRLTALGQRVLEIK